MVTRRAAIRACLTVPIALLFAVPATASTVVIWPVDPVLKPGELATALWLENKGDTPVTLQVRSLAWSQPQGDDVLAPQDDIVASPPIATVPAGARQLVRIIRRRPAMTAAPERSYRLLIDELPTQTTAGEAGVASARLAIQMRYSIPLFIYAADPASQRAAIDSRILTSGKGRFVELRNDGTRHARLTNLRIISGGRERSVIPGLAGYVLPGATVRLPLPDDAPGVVKLDINGDAHTLAPTA